MKLVTMPARHWLLTVLVAACALVIGLYMGGSDLPQGRDFSETATKGAEGKSPGSAIATGGQTAEDAPPLSRENFFERLRALGAAGSQRWRREQLQHLADEVPISEIPEFIRELDQPFSLEASEAVRLLFVRWAEQDPQKA